MSFATSPDVDRAHGVSSGEKVNRLPTAALLAMWLWCWAATPHFFELHQGLRRDNPAGFAAQDGRRIDRL
jgi:hypothetical protein